MSLSFFLNLFSFFIYFWLCWVFIAVHGLSLAAASRGSSLLQCTQHHCSGFSCCGAQALGAQASVVAARGLQSAGSVVVAHGLSCSLACGIFLDHCSNPCPLHWQVDSQPLHHQGSPQLKYLNLVLYLFIRQISKARNKSYNLCTFTPFSLSCHPGSSIISK